MLELATGWLAAAGWTQSWKIVRRGHFRILAWVGIALSLIAYFSVNAALTTNDVAPGARRGLAIALVVASVVYLLVQYSRTDLPGTVVGLAAGAIGAAALVCMSSLIHGWPTALAAIELLVGAAFLGSITTGMMLGHWYLNQPGLKPSALQKLTDVGLAASVASGIGGLVAAPLLADASTEGAVLGIQGFGESFSLVFYIVWLSLLVFTGGVVWAARKCIKIRSIQSATGLFYVALLSSGVTEFLVRYLMVNAR
jgi:hypothetical protein